MKLRHFSHLFSKAVHLAQRVPGLLPAAICLCLLPHTSHAQWTTVGAADSIPDSCSSTVCYKITPDSMNRAGGVWSDSMIDLGEPFVLTFTANFGKKNFNGGEGLAFVFHRDSRGTAAIGAPGGFLGYGSSSGGAITPSLAVEFDTKATGAAGDIADDHISVVQDADLNDPINRVSATPDSSNIEDSACHRIRIVWDPLNMVLSVYFDDILRTADTINMPDSVFSGNDSVYWGITGSTGNHSNYQLVCLSPYSPCCGPCGSNLVNNWDFSGPCNTGYTNELNYEDCDSIISIGNGGYTEAADANAITVEWKGTDQSGNGSRILVIDGPVDSNMVAWAQNVYLNSGETYCFSALVKNICWDNCDPTSLELRVGGKTGALLDATWNLEYSEEWTMLCGSYTAEQTGSVEADIVINEGEHIGNDAGVDNISFRSMTDCSACCEYDIVIDEPDSTGAGCSGTIFFGIWDFAPPGCDLHAIVFDGPVSLCSRPGYARGYCLSYCLAPGQNKTLTGYVINSEGDTVCTLQKTVSCPEVIDCCEGFTAEMREDPDNPFATCCMNYYVYRNECIGCDSIYAIRDKDGNVLISTIFSPISIPPQGSAGLRLDTICCGLSGSCSHTDTLEFLDKNGNVICTKEVTGICMNKTSPGDQERLAKAADPGFTIELRPNPASSYVELIYGLDQRGPVHAELLTSDGKLAFAVIDIVQDEGRYTERIDTRALPNGIYFLRMFHAGRMETHKLVIQR